MKKTTLLGSIVCFLFSACSLISSNDETDDREYVAVAYAVPTYESVQSLAAKVDIEPPKEYNEAGKIIQYGDHLFINEPNEGIHIVNNADPLAPENLLFINLPGSKDMVVIENHLYADMYSALVVLDISDLENPVLIDDFTVEDVFFHNPYDVIPLSFSSQNFTYFKYENIDNSKGIVTGWEIELRREPLEEQIIYYDFAAAGGSISNDRTTSVSGSMARFLPVDNFLYTINGNELLLFQIGGNYQPIAWGRMDTQTQAETLYHLNDFLFVGSTTGMLLYDVTIPGNPEYLSRIEHFRSCDPVVADENYAYVTLRGGTNCFTDLNELQIISLDNPRELEITARHVLFNPHGLAIKGDHLIVCDGTAGLKVLNVSDRESPEVVTTFQIDFAYDIIIDYPTAMVVGESKLYQFDVSNLPELTKISEIALDR